MVTIAFVVGAVCGFVVGFLVFRNNQDRINNAETTIKDAAEKVKNI